MPHSGILTICFLSSLFVNSDAPIFLFIMRGSITEGCRLLFGLQPFLCKILRSASISGSYVSHRTSFYSVVRKAVAIIY